GSSAAKRIFAVVERTGRASSSGPAGTGYWIRAVQPAGKGLFDREDWQGCAVRKRRFPEHFAAVYAREPESESGVCRFDREVRTNEERDTGADRAGLAAGAESVDRSDSRNNEAASPGR